MDRIPRMDLLLWSVEALGYCAVLARQTRELDRSEAFEPIEETDLPACGNCVHWRLWDGEGRPPSTWE